MKKREQDETTETTVFDVEPFGHELDSAELIEVKAEWLRRNEGYSVLSKRVSIKRYN